MTTMTERRGRGAVRLNPPERNNGRAFDGEAGGPASPMTLDTLQSAFTNAPIGMALIGLDGSWLHVNPALCHLTGYPEAELLATTFQEITHPDDRTADLAFIAPLVAGADAGYEQEKRFLRKDGSVVWVQLNTSLVRDQTGHPLHFVAQTQDVSRRKTAELALAQEQALLGTILDRLPDPIYIKDAASRFVRVNPAAAASYGFADPAEAVGLTDFDVFPPTVAAGLYAAEQALLAGEDPVLERLEHYPGVGSGDDRWILATKAPLRDETGQPVGLVGISHDVTARVRAEADRALLAAIVESTEDGVLSCTLGGVITSWNRGAEALFGWSAAEAIGQSVEVLTAADHRGELARVLERVRCGESVVGHETVRLTRDGRRIAVALTLSPLRDTAGAVVGVASISRDVTMQKLAAAELTAAKDAAEESNRLKSAFLSTMSHELRTPMGAIIGYTGLLLEDGDRTLDPGQRADLQQISTSADRLLGLINDVLDLSRIEAGGMDLEIRPLDLTQAVEDVREELEPLADAKGIALVAEVAPDLPAAHADPLRLHQILLNLVGNAVKFTERGTVAVAARAAGDRLAVAVRDTGIGIAPEALPHVFDEFRQADGSTTRRYGGSGRGAVITRPPAARHGGTIVVESTPGAGSTFTLLLPRQPGSDHSIRRVVPASSGGGPGEMRNRRA